jgi:hypothetical protein
MAGNCLSMLPNVQVVISQLARGNVEKLVSVSRPALSKYKAGQHCYMFLSSQLLAFPMQHQPAVMPFVVSEVQL